MSYVKFESDADVWKNFEGREVGKIRDIVSQYINKNYSKGNLKVFVGSDSQRISREVFNFVNVVVLKTDDGVDRQTRIFYKRNKALLKSNKALVNLNYRLLNEVYESIGIAIDISDIVGAKNIEVHLDLNKSNQFRSNEIVNEALLACRGQNFMAVIKPDSFAASSVADRLSK